MGSVQRIGEILEGKAKCHSHRMLLQDLRRGLPYLILNRIAI
jgi:hypothetical protein